MILYDFIKLVTSGRKCSSMSETETCHRLRLVTLCFLASEKLLGVWREMEQTAVSCGQVQLSVFLYLCVWVSGLCSKKTSNPSVGVQAQVSELEEEMMQLQPDIVDVQRQPWRSGEALDTL